MLALPSSVFSKSDLDCCRYDLNARGSFLGLNLESSICMRMSESGSTCSFQSESFIAARTSLINVNNKLDSEAGLSLEANAHALGETTAHEDGMWDSSASTHGVTLLFKGEVPD